MFITGLIMFGYLFFIISIPIVIIEVIVNDLDFIKLTFLWGIKGIAIIVLNIFMFMVIILLKNKASMAINISLLLILLGLQVVLYLRNKKFVKMKIIQLNMILLLTPAVMIFGISIVDYLVESYIKIV